MMSFLSKVISLTLITAVALLGVTAGYQLTDRIIQITVAQAGPQDNKEETQKRYKNLELFQKVLHFIENNYVDEVENDKLIHGAIKGMLETLDPHSNFLPPEVFKDMKIDTSGKFGGLGIEIGLKDNVLTIVTPIEDTPAWKAGIKPGDRIVKIDGTSTKGMTLVEAVAKMRGKKGSKVNLTIFRKGFEKVKDVSVVRDDIKIRSVKSDTLEPGFGYIRLSSFNEDASQDVEKALKAFLKKGPLKGLVFDLRYDPGGLLDQAVDVSSLFIDDGVVVSTIGRNKDQKEVKHARKGKAHKDFPMAILVNSSTASAAEIVAGALQDHTRAVVMGQPTFGKGSVQTVIELGKEMGLKLTIARYFTPSGRSIQEKGVIPDILLDEYDPKLLEKARLQREGTREKDLPGHIVNNDDKEREEFEVEELKRISESKDSKAEDASDDDMAPLKFVPKEDYQVKEAVNYLKSYEIFKKMAEKKGDKSSQTAVKSGQDDNGG